MYYVKVVKYLIEAIFIYFFFLLIKILGLSISRKIFSIIFKITGPLFRSEKIVNSNLDIRENEQLVLSVIDRLIK